MSERMAGSLVGSAITLGQSGWWLIPLRILAKAFSERVFEPLAQATRST